MKKDQLLAMRSAISLAEHHIRLQRPSHNRLMWTKLLRKAWQGAREVTHQFLDDAEAHNKNWKDL